MAKKNKIPLSPEAPVRLNNPFAGLQSDGLPAAPAEEPAPVPSKPKLGRVVLRRETAHRGGKMVIVVDDFAYFISMAKIEELARKLRHACGCGGTMRERTIELQGNHVARIRALLEEEGFKVAGIT
ncbi:MAG TPA: translation initiation factor [Verrucomicrobiae bacterium]|jgi:translation initiation factor 1